MKDFIIYRRDFIFSIASLLLSSCASKNEIFSHFLLLNNGNIFPEELKSFIESKSWIEGIFNKTNVENPIITIVRSELSILQKELNKINYEKIKLSGKIIFENILVRFFNILEMYLFAYDLYRNQNSYSFKLKSASTYELSPIALHPGSILKYSFKGYCMNRSLGAPGAGDTLIIYHFKDLRLNDNIKRILMCVINNHNKFNNPQGVVWFLIELENKDFINANYKYIESEIMRISTVCPEAKGLYEKFKVEKIIRDFIKILPMPKIKIGNLEYSLYQVFTEPEVTNKVLEELINLGNKTPGPKGPGYSEILPNVFAEAVGNGTLSAYVRILNYNPYLVNLDLREFYAKPVAKKQRISFPYEVSNVSIQYPYPSQSDLQVIHTILCSALSLVISFFLEEKIVKALNPINKIKFLYNMLNFIVGYDILKCEKLKCRERLETLYDILTFGILNRKSSLRRNEIKLDSFKKEFNNFIKYAVEKIVIQEISDYICPSITTELTKEGVFYETDTITNELCNRYNFVRKYFDNLENLIKCN